MESGLAARFREERSVGLWFGWGGELAEREDSGTRSMGWFIQCSY
ncbi:hypothetical protein RSSM_04625 [Rhodopirellula sallentina SM41]|uniref:Uncharacterized protein n=1 Tax=Rhodopirellula sallentina SM41 TaxID=1263870 RepID=M5TY34_9BACT|nr:hypothetical protein RSSM_04625 [Rhodopirellula sallentina SM41]